MIRAFTLATDLAAGQRAFRQEFYEGAAILAHGIGFPGGGTTADIAWHAEAGIWGYVDDPESSRELSRYWNPFGLEDPMRVSSLSITFEVNPPLKGANRRVGGVIGRATDGAVVLLHRGNIGGGHQGVGKDLFTSHFSGKYEYVSDGDGLEDCAVVATLGRGTLVSDLRRFADDVARMKAIARGR